MRLTVSEQESLRKKSIELNRLLISKGREPLKDSEIVHAILSRAIEVAELNEKGEIIVR